MNVVNLGQFLPLFHAAVRSAPHLDLPAAPAATAAAGDEGPWQEVKGLADPQLAGLLDDLRARGVSVPEVGYEITDANGRVTAELELAWPGAGVAVVADGGKAAANWRTWSIDAVIDDATGLAEALGA
jgi:hypothetical protein